MDAQVITQTYSALKAIKELGESIIKGKIDAEAKEKVSEMMSRLGHIQDQLFEIREQLINQQDENHKLRELNNKLQNDIASTNKMFYEKPFYWSKEDGGEKDGPFCQKCFDATKKTIRLQDKGNDLWKCYECQQFYKGPNYREPNSDLQRG
jgi:regulator of replication initiation timing